MNRVLVRFFAATFAIASLSLAAHATDIPIGFISYDVTGTNVAQFDIVNLTGANSSGDASFPVTTSVLLSNLSLTVDFAGGGSHVFNSSYFTLDADGLSFDGKQLSTLAGPPTGLFGATDAILTGVFSTGNLTLFDGSTATVVREFSATISDPGGLSDGDLASDLDDAGNGFDRAYEHGRRAWDEGAAQIGSCPRRWVCSTAGAGNVEGRYVEVECYYQSEYGGGRRFDGERDGFGFSFGDDLASGCAGFDFGNVRRVADDGERLRCAEGTGDDGEDSVSASRIADCGDLFCFGEWDGFERGGFCERQLFDAAGGAGAVAHADDRYDESCGLEDREWRVEDRLQFPGGQYLRSLSCGDDGQPD
jgi:hypothetical protein